MHVRRHFAETCMSRMKKFQEHLSEDDSVCKNQDAYKIRLELRLGLGGWLHLLMPS